MKHCLIVGIVLCLFTIVTPAQGNPDCIAPIGSRIALGAEISISDDAFYDVPSQANTGFFEGDDGSNGIIIDGPICRDGQQFWRVFYDFYFTWVDVRQLAPPYPVAPSFHYGEEVSDDLTQTIAGITFTQPATIQTRTIATIPISSALRRNTFRVHSRQQFRMIAFDFPSEYFGSGNTWITPGIFVFSNQGLPAEMQSQFDMALENPTSIGETLFLQSIPSTNAATPILADGTGVDLNEGGQGFRYLTYFTQSATEVPDQLNYIYQGITSDGTFIAGVFPVQVDYSGTEYETFMQTTPSLMQDQTAYEEMISTAWATLGTLQHDAFSPNLDDLDRMMRSIEVGAIPADVIYAGFSCDPTPDYWQNFSDRTAPIAVSYLRAGIIAERIEDSSSIIRESASTNAREVGRVPAGATVNVLSGPQCSGDYAWFDVQYGNLRGWVAEGYDNTRWFIPTN